MKIALGVVGLILLFSLPAHAQISGSAISFGTGGPNFGGMIHNQVTKFDVVVAKGSDQTFDPSGFVSFQAAIAEGQAELARKQMTVVELAAITRKERQAREAVFSSPDPATGPAPAKVPN